MIRSEPCFNCYKTRFYCISCGWVKGVAYSIFIIKHTLQFYISTIMMTSLSCCQHFFLTSVKQDSLSKIHWTQLWSFIGGKAEKPSGQSMLITNSSVVMNVYLNQIKRGLLGSWEQQNSTWLCLMLYCRSWDPSPHTIILPTSPLSCINYSMQLIV